MSFEFWGISSESTLPQINESEQQTFYVSMGNLVFEFRSRAAAEQFERAEASAQVFDNESAALAHVNSLK